MRAMASSAVGALVLSLLVVVLQSPVNAATCPGTSASAATAAACDSSFVPVRAKRIYDSRNHERLGPGERLNLTVSGRGGVPAAGAVAVTLNLTAVDPTKRTHLTVWPKGQPRPVASSLHLRRHATRAAFVVAAIGSDGKVSIANDRGRTDVVVDVTGYHVLPASSGKLYHPAKPFRLFDSRDDGAGKLAHGEKRRLKLPGLGGVLPKQMRAALVNVTAVGADGPGFLTVHRAGTTRPDASTLNFSNAHPVTNRAVTKLRKGAMKVTNRGTATHVVVDVVGWYGSGKLAGGHLYSPLQPQRVLDTRKGVGAPSTPVGANAEIALDVAGAGRPLPAGASVAVMTLTSTRSSSSTYLKTWASGTGQPFASDVNVRVARTTSNLVVVPIGADGRVNLLNRYGSTDLVADLVGYYRPASAAAPAAAPAPASSPGVAQPAPAGACDAQFPGDPCAGTLFYGASVEGGNPETLEAQSGNMSLYRSYMVGSTPTSKFVSRASTDVANGRISLISTKVPGSWAAVAAGTHDAWLLERIKALAAVNGPVWLALHHEPAGDGAPADWVAMQQHARQLIDANSSNIALVGILNGWDFKANNGNPGAFNHPVGTGVDVMGFDSYNGWSPTNGKKWQPAADVFAPGVTIAGWGYPTLVGEYGVRTDPANPGRAAQWLRDAYAFAVANGFVGLSYFNSGLNSPDGPWTLDSERLPAFMANLESASTATL